MERLILIQVDTQEILDYNATYFLGDLNKPPVGLDPNLEYLIEFEPTPRPDVDTRLYTITMHKNITSIPHPVYTYFNQYQVTYTTTIKTDADIKNAVTDRDEQAARTVFVADKQMKHLTICLALIINKVIDGGTPNTQQLNWLSIMKDRGIKLVQNDTNRANKIAEVENSTIPDLETGWDETPIDADQPYEDPSD